jgi:hypothetical protein
VTVGLFLRQILRWILLKIASLIGDFVYFGRPLTSGNTLAASSYCRLPSSLSQSPSRLTNGAKMGPNMRLTGRASWQYACYAVVGAQMVSGKIESNRPGCDKAPGVRYQKLCATDSGDRQRNCMTIPTHIMKSRQEV